MSSWQSTEHPPPLAGREVHLWRFALAQPAAVVAQATALLSADEHARAARLRAEPARQAYVIARGALRLVLGSYLDVPAARLSFVYAPAGKPALAPLRHPQAPAFSLSHAGAYGLVAVAAGGPIGVDHEPIGPLELASLVPLVCSPHEAQALRALAPAEQRAAFYRCWTCKEAYLKARGEGLSDSLQQLSVALDPRSAPALLADRRDPQAPQRWSITTVEVAPGYAGALAFPWQSARIGHYSAEPFFVIP